MSVSRPPGMRFPVPAKARQGAHNDHNQQRSHGHSSRVANYIPNHAGMTDSPGIANQNAGGQDGAASRS
jgi:hypothetical protein